VAIDPHAGPRRRYHQAISTTGASGDLAAMALYTGQPAVLASEPRPAAQIVTTIAREAAGVLGRAAGTAVNCQ